MPKNLKTFYSAKLKNNCPECYTTDGLELTFSQEWNENVWSKHTTNTITEMIRCHHCKARIYPAHWTDAIDLVYAYHLKRAEKEHYFKLKPLSIALIVIIVVAIGVGIYLAYK